MEGRAPSSSFDGNAYLKANPDVKRAKLCPLLHYEKFGRQQGRALNCENTQKSLENSVKSVFGHARELQTDVFFSVIVASYNYQDYIKETLDSLINQTYRNFEVIVVDDGSKDGSVGVIKEYANQYDFIKLYQHENGENRGLVETVDLGVKVSKGEYIAFCESDDYWTVDHLDCINKQIKKTKGLVIVNNVQPFGDEDRTSVMAAVIEHRKQAIQRFDGRIPDQDFRGANYIVTFSAACVNAMLLKSCDISSCTRRQSLDWWIWRQVCYGNKIEFVDKVLTYWRLHESFSVKNATGELVESGKTSDDILDCFRNALDAVIKARTHMSSSALNSKLADFDVFKRIGLQKRKMDVCKQLSNADCKGVKFLYVTQTSRVERPILDPSSRYRCYHGAETILRKGGFANVVSASKFMQQPNYDYDVYVFHRPSASLLPLIESLRGLNKILIADYDDLIFGTKREAIQSSAYKNNSLSLDAATKVFANNLEGLVAFDYVSVSTEPLRDMVKRFNPTAVVATVHNFIPNSIFRLTEQSELLSKPKIDNSIIYCSGTWSHNKDFLIVSDILLDVLQKNESLQFVAMGVLKTDDRFSVCSRVYFHDVVDYWKLFSIMSSMKFAIAPLEQSVFNDCKSDVKFLEAAVAGVLLIASPSPDMKRVSDAHIVLPKDASEWEYYLKHLPELWSSEKVRENYEYVKQNCSENTFLSEFSCMFNERNENY